MDLTERRKYYNRCNPSEALAPGDSRNVDIDQLELDSDQGEPRVEVRGSIWADELARPFELSDNPATVFFTGLQGSGKTTELRRLTDRLRLAQGAHLLPVTVDVQGLLDLAAPIDVPDLLIAILYVIEQRLLKAENKNPDEAFKEGYWERLWNWLGNTEIEIDRAEVGFTDQTSGFGAKLIGSFKAQESFRKQAREKIAGSFAAFFNNVETELKRHNERAKTLGFKGLVVLVDSLEKLRGIGANWKAVLESAEYVFGRGAPYLRLPVPTLYTVPPALIRRLPLEVVVSFMPMIKLTSREGAVYEHGFMAMRKMIHKRIPDEGALQEIFGADYETALRDIIAWTGGYPRDLIRLLQLSIEDHRRHPLGRAGVKRICLRLTDQYTMTLTTADKIWLRSVHRNKKLVIDSDEDREMADRLVQYNIVLRYKNDTEWWDVHPAVRVAIEAP